MKYLFQPLFILLVASSYGQSVKYYSKTGEIASKESCHYYSKYDGISGFADTLRTYYCSNNSLRSAEPLDEKGRSDGITLFYFENGQLRTKVKKYAGLPVELAETWYPDGTKQSDEYYDPDSFKSKLVNYWDSTGIQLVSNGTGYCRCIFEASRERSLLESGKLVSGKRDSVWAGHLDGNLYYTETYRNGTFLSGTSFDRNGNQFSYEEVEVTAAPQGGMPAFYSFVGSTITYPKRARRLGIDGKVYVEFIVEKDGSLSNVKTIKGIGADCDREAERVIALSKKWIPGRQRGQAVRQKMVLPIAFRLS